MEKISADLAAAAIKTLYDNWECGILVLGEDAKKSMLGESMAEHYTQEINRALNILARYVQDHGGYFGEDNVL